MNEICLSKETEALAFITKHKEDYLYFLKECFTDSFPLCCDMSTQVLFSYLTVHFGVGELIGGDYVENPHVTTYGDYFKQKKQFHSWGKIGDSIIDFTYFQFLADEVTIEEASDTHNKQWLYQALVEKLQGSLQLEPTYARHLVKKSPVNPVYLHLAIDRTFPEYLEEIHYLYNQDSLEFLELSNEEYEKKGFD